MRISMVSEQASPLATDEADSSGGCGDQVARLADLLARAGHSVSVYTRRTDPSLPERSRTDQGYEVVHVPAGPATPLGRGELYPYLGDFSRFLARDWGSTPPDLAHAHFWTSGLATVLAAREVPVPVVQSFHSLGLIDRRRLGSRDNSPAERIATERVVGRTVTAVLSSCRDEVTDLVRTGVPRSKVHVVPGGVDLEEFQPEGPAVERTAGRRVLAVGPLVRRQGFDLVIAALPGIPDAELIIAGGGPANRLADDPEANRLRGLARQFGVADRVHLLGQVESSVMPALLRSADVLACTPVHEQFGRSAVEAMACGVPVVATAVGGLTDSVVDGVTGVHVPPNDPAALRRTLRGMLSDQRRRAALGTAGRDRACSCYSWDRVVNETLRAYNRTVEKWEEWSVVRQRGVAPRADQRVDGSRGRVARTSAQASMRPAG
jgi:D-inositol-3-phosphate glycosyltransferase